MRPGELVDGRYFLEQPAGAGGMGVVFRAIDEQTGRHVALKVLTGTTPDELARARREALALSVLTHSAIVKYVGNGVTRDGLLYVAMEWIEGSTVSSCLDHAGFSVREAVAIALRIAGALAAAHDADILHRDVKPGNIVLVGGDIDRAMLIDFGVARFVGGVTSLTKTGMAMGTPGYMAPEQVRGAKDLSPATDVFGLGSTLYEMVTGRYAFASSNQAGLMMKVLVADPIPVTELCREAPASLVDVIEKMLDKNPDTRLADGRAALAALAGIGDVVDGPRRPVMIVDAPSAKLGKRGHVMIIASRGHPDDICDPPSLELQDDVEKAINAWGGTMIVLATGAVVAQLEGPVDELSSRATRCANEIRERLLGWIIAVSPVVGDRAAAADRGAEKLATEAISAVFEVEPT